MFLSAIRTDSCRLCVILEYALSVGHNNLRSRVAAVKPSVFLMSFAAFALYGMSSTASGDFRGLEFLSCGGILLPLSQCVLGTIQHAAFFDVACDCTFNATKGIPSILSDYRG